MADPKPLRVAREAGLTASRGSSAGGPAGPRGPRLRPAELAEHRLRRVRLGSYLLGFSLLLGLAWMGLYLAAAFPPTGVPSTLVGTVLDYTSDSPVVNATVSIENTTLSTASDAAGNFTLTGVPSGPVRLRIDAAGYRNTTFALFILPPSSGDPKIYNGFRLMVQRGDGPVFEDAVGPRTASVGACLAIFAVGIVLNAVGYLSTRTRRRYGHSVLGAVGAFLSVGFYIGPLLGLVAYILLRGAREAFLDRRSLFSPGTGPPLYDEEEEAEGEGEEAEDAGDNGPDEGPGDEGGRAVEPPKGGPKGGEAAKEESP